MKEQYIDFIQILNQPYFICLSNKNITIYKNNAYKVFKTIKNNYDFKCIVVTNDGNILLGGKIIAVLNANDWTFTILYKEDLEKKRIFDLERFLDISCIIMTYNNKIICREKIYKPEPEFFIYEEEKKYENNIIIFNIMPNSNSIELSAKLTNFDVKNIFINEKDEIIFVTKDNVHIFE